MSALTDEIDALLAARFSEIEAAQSAFFAHHGRYCQLVPTHSEVPAEGVAVAPDRADESVSDVGIAWNDLGSLPAEMVSCLEIHVYDGPRGAGYVVIVRTIEAGVLMVKQINVGSETERSHDWRAEE